MDSTASIQSLKDKVREFCEERDWDQFHSPKDLAIGVSTEASELLEIFRFKSEEEIRQLLLSPAKEEIENEVSDVLFMLIRFAQRNDIDIETAFVRKLEKNALKYPIGKCKGKNMKYTVL
jgi:NTP pyrophosphatase (non-canonical NTP hydrolase)